MRGCTRRRTRAATASREERNGCWLKRRSSGREPRSASRASRTRRPTPSWRRASSSRRSARGPADAAFFAQGLADPLTGLAARPLFVQRLSAAVERARRSPGTAVALILFNVDRFKVVNDSLGHAAGDELLRGIAGRIRDTLQ